jgi:hypothetical protein
LGKNLFFFISLILQNMKIQWFIYDNIWLVYTNVLIAFRDNVFINCFYATVIWNISSAFCQNIIIIFNILLWFNKNLLLKVICRGLCDIISTDFLWRKKIDCWNIIIIFNILLWFDTKFFAEVIHRVDSLRRLMWRYIDGF